NVYDFDENSSVKQVLIPESGNSGSNFGENISTNEKGLTAITAPTDSEFKSRSGAIYLYYNIKNSLEFTIKVKPKELFANELFGSSLDLSDRFLTVGSVGKLNSNIIRTGA